MISSKPSYSSNKTALKHKDKKYKQVTIDDPHTIISSDEPSSESDEDFKLRKPSLSNAPDEWGGLPTAEIIIVACIMDCPTKTVHADKCYIALIDSGAVISLLRYSTYKKLRIVTRPHTTCYPDWDSSVGRAVDCHATGPGFNTHSKPGWGLTQPSIPLWVGKMSTSKNVG